MERALNFLAKVVVTCLAGVGVAATLLLFEANPIQAYNTSLFSTRQKIFQAELAKIPGADLACTSVEERYFESDGKGRTIWHLICKPSGMPIALAYEGDKLILKQLDN